MKYTEIRPNIKSGDILAWTHKSWKTYYDLEIQMVRFATQSEYNHIGVAWVINSRVFVIEAVVPEVRIYPLSVQTPFYWSPCGTSYWDKDVEDFALSKIGEKYSKWEAIKGFLNILRVGKNNIWQCAELTNSILTRSGVFPNTKVKSTPSAIIEHVQQMGFPVYLIEK